MIGAYFLPFLAKPAAYCLFSKSVCSYFYVNFKSWAALVGILGEQAGNLASSNLMEFSPLVTVISRLPTNRPPLQFDSCWMIGGTCTQLCCIIGGHFAAKIWNHFKSVCISNWYVVILQITNIHSQWSMIFHNDADNHLNNSCVCSKKIAWICLKYVWSSDDNLKNDWNDCVVCW